MIVTYFAAEFINSYFLLTLLFGWSKLYFPIKILIKLCFCTRPFLNGMFLMLNPPTDFPPQSWSGSWLKSQTANFILFRENSLSS